MRTIIVTGFSTLWCLPLLLGFALFGRGLMWRVSDFLRQNALAGQRHSILMKWRHQKRKQRGI